MPRDLRGPAEALSLLLGSLTGCSHRAANDRPVAAATPVSPSISTPVSPSISTPVSPSISTPGPAAAPATAASTASLRVVPRPVAPTPTDIAAGDTDTTHRGTAQPSRPAGRPLPRIDSVRVAWIQGTVTTGSSGPCYGIVTGGGVAYALYSSQGYRLTTGDQVRARITPGPTPVRCGTGRPGRLERLLVRKLSGG